MASFSTEAVLSIAVPDSEVRSAKRTIESGLGDINIGVSSSGAASRATRTDGGAASSVGGRRGRRMFRWARERTSYMETAVDLLTNIEEKVGDSGGGGGGGLLGGIGSFGLGRLSTVSITGLVTGSLGSIGGYLSGASITSFVGGTLGSITSYISGASITTFVTGGLGSIASYLAGTTIGSFITGGLGSLSVWISGVSLASLITGAGAVAALLYGIVSLSDIIDGDISGWNLPGQFGMALGRSVRENFPDAADLIEDVFTKNLAHSFGQWIREGLVGESPDTPNTTQRTRENMTVEDRFLPGRGGSPIPPGGGVDVSNDFLDNLVSEGAETQSTETSVAVDATADVTVEERVSDDDIRRVTEEEVSSLEERLEQRIADAAGNRRPGP